MNQFKKISSLLLSICILLSFVSVSAENEKYITLSIEKFTLGLGYLKEPVKVPFADGDSLSKIFVNYISQDNCKFTGKTDKNFYLISIKDSDTRTPVIPQYIIDKSKITDVNPLVYTKNDPDWLGQTDYYYMSGWLCVKNNKFLSIGMSASYPQDGDVVRLQYSVSGYGKDLGSGSTVGTDGNADYSNCWVKTANKDSLIKAVAEINSSPEKDNILSNDSVKTAYDNAYTILTNIESEQATVDEALTGLQTSLNNSNENNPAYEMKYTITYHSGGANGNVPVDTNEYTQNSAAAIKSAEGLTYQSYMFKGWNTLENGSGESFSELQQITVNGNLDLYATWEKLTSYDSNESADTNSSIADIKTYDIPSIISVTADYIIKNNPNPQVGSVGGEWPVIALARMDNSSNKDYYDTYYKNLLEFLKANNGVLSGTKNTEYSRVILALTAIGKDPSNIGGYNLLDNLSDMNKLKLQGINGPLWALAALDSHNYEVPQISGDSQATREKLIDYIISLEKPTGGFSLGEGETADADISAMVLQVLSKYKDNSKVQPCIIRTLNLLANIQQDNGGFMSNNEFCLESGAQALTALTSLGIDPESDERFIKNGNTVISAIMQFKKDNGGFAHILNSDAEEMATEQALYSLVAYDRYKNNKSSLYDMNDVTLEKIEVPVKTEPEKTEIVETPIQTNIFRDLENHWAKTEIYNLYGKKAINGVTSDTFEPDRSITRAEFAAIFSKALTLEPVLSDKFEDVKKDDWFSGYIGALASSGLIGGKSETIFEPNADINREEAATIIARAFKILKIETTVSENEITDLLAGFVDYKSCSDWSASFIAGCVKSGVISQENIELRPLEKITRAEAAVMIYRLLINNK